MTPIVKFYATNAPYGAFSNFSRHPIDVDGRVWPTSEHYFQARKFIDQSDIDAVHAAPTPFEAARIGRERHRSFRRDWEQIRDDVMLAALRAKFSQHEDLREILASTQGATLVEHTANDSYWADGGDGSGTNRLGTLLEQVRDELCAGATPMMVPEWIAYPEIERSDLFWRMGGGEGHSTACSDFRNSLGPAAIGEYEAYFGKLEDWR
jgi:ribA/ribD-fused uncharacterized protein